MRLLYILQKRQETGGKMGRLYTSENSEHYFHEISKWKEICLGAPLAGVRLNTEGNIIFSLSASN
jgi:hypothetical protein